MDPAQLDQFLDNQIARYKKTRRFYFWGGSMIMFFLSVIFSFALFYPSKLLLNNQIPDAARAVIYIIGLFVILELVLLFGMFRESREFYKMTHAEKRLYFYKRFEKNAQKICPNCGLIFDLSKDTCERCGGNLEMSHNYLWVDDNKQEDPNTAR